MFVRQTSDDIVVSLPLSLLAGSGLTAAVYAVLTRIGVVDGAIYAVAAASVAILVLRRATAWGLIRGLGAEYRATLRDNRLLRLVAAPLAALLWICAIAPPRDADVMRYHLAHVRQIISDGRWETIRDFHYAFPFGWTLGYLPFERLHLPEAAALVNVGLWLVMLGGLFRIARASKTIPPAAWICVAFLAHPFVLRVFSSAMADGYAVFVVYSIAVLLLRADNNNDVTHSALLGFACWIGAQSRYQLLAAALAGTTVFIGMAIRSGSRQSMASFSKGAAAALILSAPFYVANLKDFGNPFWPLFISQINGVRAYADHVASIYAASLVGHYDLRSFAARLIELITTPFLVPLALVLILLVPASLTSRAVIRRIAIFGSLILVMWAVAQPRLFPKHVILLLPIGPMLAVAALEGRTAGRVASRVMRVAFATAIVTMIAASTMFSWDYVRYAVTGNRAEYHRFTWYYRVYDWVNSNTARDARFLVVAYSGHSYYLDRQYRRADPWLSGVVDWSSVSSSKDLEKVVDDGGYDYMIYDDRDWSDFVGGQAMSTAVRSAMSEGRLVPVRQFREKLYSSRFFRESKETTIHVLRRAGK